MNRRRFSQSLSLGAIGSFFAAARGTPSLTAKEWARENLKGMGNALMPSFTPDFKHLDEDGIRLDVRQSIKHGFSSCTISRTGADAGQRNRMRRS